MARRNIPGKCNVSRQEQLKRNNVFTGMQVKFFPINLELQFVRLS
jgi:hypothetical protein